MENTEITPEIVEEIPEVVVLPELRYEYQPKDLQGRNLGGKQVIVYKTTEELADKMASQNELLIRKLREVTKDQRLGRSPDEKIPDDAERFEEMVEFRPRELSAQERFQISQDLNDPEKFPDARDRLLESAVGAPPEKIAAALNKGQLFQMQMRARDNYYDFVNSGSGYADIAENREVITNWMFKHKLAPVVKNFQYAYETLKEAGLLLDAPVVQQEPIAAAAVVPPVVTPPVAVVAEEVNPQLPAEQVARISDEAQPQVKRQSHVPSGLNDRTSSPTGVVTTPVDGNSMTLGQIDAVPADKLKKLMQEPAFRRHYDALLLEAEKKRQAKIIAAQSQ